jgi:hypothetical protein
MTPEKTRLFRNEDNNRECLPNPLPSREACRPQIQANPIYDFEMSCASASLHAPEFLAELVDGPPNGRTAHRFWQRGGGYDRNLRSVRDIHEKIRYVHENPPPPRARCTRRGLDLVERPGVGQPDLATLLTAYEKGR